MSVDLLFRGSTCVDLNLVKTPDPEVDPSDVKTIMLPYKYTTTHTGM